MQLPYTLRDNLVEELDDYLDALGSDPDAEAAAAYVIELLEAFADEEGYDDLLVELEAAGELDEPLAESLEQEMSSNDEFEFTGEELVVLLEKLCAIEWDDEDLDDDDDFDEEEEEEEEEEDEL